MHLKSGDLVIYTTRSQEAEYLKESTEDLFERPVTRDHVVILSYGIIWR
jgi:hypothetical protein